MAYSIGSDFVIEASDFVIEYPCTLCSGNKDSVKFCVECNQYLCKTCLGYHNKLLKKHELLDKDTFKLGTPSPATGGNKSLLGETCDIHQGKPIDIYCVQHDVVCCSACVVLHHNDCKKQYIPDIATTFFTAGQVQSLDKEMEILLEDFKGLKKVKQDNKPRVLNDKAAGLRAAKERRKELNADLDKLEAQFEKDIIDKHTDIDGKLDSDVKTCDETIALLDTFRKNIQFSTNDSQKFLILRRAKQVMKDAETKRNQCQENGNEKLTFALSVPELEFGCDQLKTSYGEVHAGYKAPESLKLEEDIHIKASSDESLCTCNDICQLKDGTIVLVDENNMSVKVLHNDKQGKNFKSLRLSSTPYCICAVGEHEVAVGFYDEVHFISASPKLSFVRSFHVSRFCCTIVCFETLIFTGHVTGAMTAYNFNGSVVNTFDHILRACFDSKILISPDKRNIVSTFAKRGISISDKLSGELITRYVFQNVNFIQDICYGEGGNIFLVDKERNYIGSIGIDKNVTVVLQNLKGNPKSIFYDKKRKQLLVSCKNSNHIQSYSLIY